MVFGVGIDLIEVDRVLEACEREPFLKNAFTDSERREASSDKRRLAGDFAVKEAVAKALGTGFGGVAHREIEVLRNRRGKPYVRLYGSAEEFCRDHNIDNIQVSISNTDEFVTAYAVAEGEYSL